MHEATSLRYFLSLRLADTAAILAIVVAATLILCSGESQASKYRSVPLSNILRTSTKTVNLGGTLFRYAAFREFAETKYGGLVFRMNRTTCRSITFSGGEKDAGFGPPPTKAQLVVLSEGRATKTWQMPLFKVGYSPTFELSPRRALVVKLRPTDLSGRSRVWLNGSANCSTWNGR